MMEQNLFVEEPKKKTKNVKMIGAGLSIEFHRNNKKKFNFKNQNVIIKKVDLSDRMAKKLFVIEKKFNESVFSLLAPFYNIISWY